MVKTMTTPKVPMGRRKRIRSSVGGLQLAAVGIDDPHRLDLGRGLLRSGCGGGGAFFNISADVIERFCGVFNGLPAEEWTEAIFFWMLRR